MDNTEENKHILWFYTFHGVNEENKAGFKVLNRIIQILYFKGFITS